MRGPQYDLLLGDLGVRSNTRVQGTCLLNRSWMMGVVCAEIFCFAVVPKSRCDLIACDEGDPGGSVRHVRGGRALVLMGVGMGYWARGGEVYEGMCYGMGEGSKEGIEGDGDVDGQICDDFLKMELRIM